MVAVVPLAITVANAAQVVVVQVDLVHLVVAKTSHRELLWAVQDFMALVLVVLLVGAQELLLLLVLLQQQTLVQVVVEEQVYLHLTLQAVRVVQVIV
jgi:hypothetical protein